MLVTQQVTASHSQPNTHMTRITTLKEANDLVQDTAALLSALVDHAQIEPKSLSVTLNNSDGSKREIFATELVERINALQDQIDADDNIIDFPIAKQNNNTPHNAA